jgi:hypothetical protein
MYGRGTTYIVRAGRMVELRTAARDKREPRAGQVAGESGREANRMAGDSRRRLWLYAVHYDTSGIGHWALWVADRTAQTLTYYDSHGKTAGQEFVPHYTREMVESQAYVQRHAWQAAGDSSGRRWTVRVATVPPQGGVECAVRVMLHGLYVIVCGVNSGTEAKDLQCMEAAAEAKMRVFVSACIIRGAIRVPEEWPVGHDGQEAEWRMRRGPGGVVNAGNTCFMAVMVQGWAASGIWRGMCGDGPVTTAVAETVARVAAGRQARNRIQSLKGAMADMWPQYADRAQHDAVEFGLRVREAVHNEKATTGTGRTAMIAERVKCPCGHEGEPVVAESDGMDVDRCARLQDEMAETETEVEYQCTACGKTTAGRKRRWVVSAGEVLEVRVRRSRQGAGGAVEKDAEFMAYPSAGLVVAGGRYELRGVAVHHGANMTSGHYTAYVMREGWWYLANDEDVDQVEEETVMQQEAYVLWYCRETAYAETEEAEEATVEQTEEESAERGAAIKGKETMEGEAGAGAGDGQRQARATETERVRRAGPSWRAVIGVDEQASGEAARKRMRESMWCLSAEDETVSEQERNGAKKMMERLMRARKAMVDEERAASGGRRRRWGITEEERSRRAGRRHVPCMAHQCPPINIRRLPVGTLVEVRGSAEGTARISLGRAGGGGCAWRGTVVQQQNMCGEYIVDGHEMRGWADRFDPCVVPEGTVRVPWPLITVVGGPAAGGEGDAGGWVEYVRLWKAECTRHFGEGGGRSVKWMDARTRVQAAEEARARRGSAARERTADKGEKRAASGGEMAEAEERRVRFERDHIRLQGQVGPRGVGPRTPHHGGPIIANTTEALGRFLARKSGVDPTARTAAVAAAKESEERRRAERARSEAADAKTAQAPMAAATAQRGAGASSSVPSAAAGSGTARAAATPATGKRQRKEEDRAGQAATATAKPHSDTRQMDVAMEGGGGAARAAAGAEPAAKTKKARKPRSAQGKAKKAERNAKRFG